MFEQEDGLWARQKLSFMGHLNMMPNAAVLDSPSSFSSGPLGAHATAFWLPQGHPCFCFKTL